jgi:hypothetical protein
MEWMIENWKILLTIAVIAWVVIEGAKHADSST